MKLTEQQLRAIVRESIVRTLQENSLNEGKLGRALGTMALGGALMMGNPQDANAQLDFRYEEPIKRPQKPDNNTFHFKDWKFIERRSGVEYPSLNQYKYCVYDYTGDDLGYFELSHFATNPAEESIKTLESILSLIDKQIGYARSVCPDGREYCFKYNPEQKTVSISPINGHTREGTVILTKDEILNAISFIKINQLEWDTYDEEMNKYRSRR